MSIEATSVQPTSAQGVGVPPGVSAGEPAAKQAYSSSLAFEQMLVSELAQSLVQGSGLEGEGEGGLESGGEASGGEGASGSGNPVLASLVPQALSESVMSHGGLGLAGALTDAIDPAAAKSSAAVSSPTGGAAR